jgi:hypothetical protein
VRAQALDAIQVASHVVADVTGDTAAAASTRPRVVAAPGYGRQKPRVVMDTAPQYGWAGDPRYAR